MHDQDPTEDTTEDGLGQTSSGLTSAESLLFGQGAAGDPIAFYPSASAVMTLWRAFVSNIHPLTKMIHAPTVEKLIQLSCQNVRSISRSNQTLLLAIHFIAVNSMSDEECQRSFGSNRSVQYNKLLQATQQALNRASFLKTSDFTILTAYALYLVCHSSRLLICNTN
jgi:hypothetical protein